MPKIPVHQINLVVGVVEDRLRGRSQVSSAPLAIEQLDAEPAFELCEALREGRCRDADPFGRFRPGRCTGDGDEVFELSNREVGQRLHRVQNTSEFLK